MKRYVVLACLALPCVQPAQAQGLAELSSLVQEFGTLQGMAEYCGIGQSDGTKLSLLVQTVVDGSSSGTDREALFGFYRQGMFAGAEMAHKGFDGKMTCSDVIAEVGKITSRL